MRTGFAIQILSILQQISCSLRLKDMQSNKTIVLQGRALQNKNQNNSPLFELRSGPIPKPNQSTIFLIKVLSISIDPIMNVWLSGAQTYYPKVELGDVFHCFGVAEVIWASSNSPYPNGTIVYGNTGTAKYMCVDQKRLILLFPLSVENTTRFSPHENVYLMNNGLAAYGAMSLMGEKIHQGYVVVSTAAGATGILMCQLLKYKGCKVIGLTSQGKTESIKEYCDIVVDYTKRDQLVKVLRENKFSAYMDNVGEWLLDLVLAYIQPFGIVTLCGATANYLDFKNRQGLRNYSVVISKRLTLRGYNAGMFFQKIDEVFNLLDEMRKKNSLKLIIETLPIEKFQEGLRTLMSGKNVGKLVVSP